MNSTLIRVLPSNQETQFFEVQSTDGKKWYDTWYDKDHHWICSCPQYYFRKKFCKHMKAVAEMFGIKDTMVYEEVRL